MVYKTVYKGFHWAAWRAMMDARHFSVYRGSTLARKLAMTWVPAGRRWVKKHRGKMYAVSCHQLGCPKTKEESAAKANSWWEAKEKEIASAPPTEVEVRANAFKVWSMVQDWSALDETSRETLVDSLVGAGQYQKIKSQAEAVISSAVKAAPRDRTVQAQVASWRQLLHGVCQSGQMSEGRFDGYCRNIGKFTAWIGEEASVDDIDEAKLEGFFNHLSVSVAARKYSPSYAHTLMMTAKQFISRLAEMKLIPLPGNIRSRRFRFNYSAPAKIETFTVKEVRELLTACDGFSERTKLYLLLMLNCGMYQNDIAELHRDEVNWSKGTLTRARSKTRERGGAVVTYKLWPETFSLLKKYRTKGEIVLTTDECNPLVRYWLEEGSCRRYDAIRSAWNRLGDRIGKRFRLGTKHLRKTSATLLGQHPQFKFYGTYFLADSPKGMSDRHYMQPNDEEFFLALDWLGGQILPEHG
jgi:integrase